MRDLHPDRPDRLTWRKSSYSGANGNCVEIAETGDAILVRNSNRPGDGAIEFTRAELAAWIAGAKAGEFDDLQ